MSSSLSSSPKTATSLTSSHALGIWSFYCQRLNSPIREHRQNAQKPVPHTRLFFVGNILINDDDDNVTYTCDETHLCNCICSNNATEITSKVLPVRVCKTPSEYVERVSMNKIRMKPVKTPGPLQWYTHSCIIHYANGICVSSN